MRNYLFILIIIYSSVFSAETTILDKILKINTKQSHEQIQLILGKIKENKEFYYIKSKDYEFRKYKEDPRMHLTFKTFRPLEHFKEQQFIVLKTLLDGDVVLGSLVGMPELGLYMEVYKGGMIKKIYWKDKWKAKNKMGFNEVLGKLGEIKIHEN